MVCLRMILLVFVYEDLLCVCECLGGVLGVFVLSRVLICDVFARRRISAYAYARYFFVLCVL